MRLEKSDQFSHNLRLTNDAMHDDTMHGLKEQNVFKLKNIMFFLLSQVRGVFLITETQNKVTNEWMFNNTPAHKKMSLLASNKDICMKIEKVSVSQYENVTRTISAHYPPLYS